MNPVLFSVCCAVIVECCTRVAWVCLVCLLLCREKDLLQCLCNERRDMGLYEVPLFVSLLEFGIETMLANFHV